LKPGRNKRDITGFPVEVALAAISRTGQNKLSILAHSWRELFFRNLPFGTYFMSKRFSWYRFSLTEKLRQIKILLFKRSQH
jgi:hypothetical protein